MAYEGVLDDIKTCVDLGVPERLPVFLCSEEFDVRVCGSRYDRFCRDADEMARVTVEAVRKYDYDWAWLQVDDCIEFETLGVGVVGEGDILPATRDYLPISDESLKKLEDHGYKIEGRMQVLLDAIKRVKDELGDTALVVGRTAAPFSSVTLAFGMTESCMLLYDNPDFMKRALKFFTDYQTRFGKDQIAAGADAICFGDCNASSHLISVESYKEFAMEGARSCTAAYRADGGVVIYHASEENLDVLDVMADVGFSSLSCGPGVDIAEAKKRVGDRVCTVGNVDPIGILANGSVEDVKRETERQVREVGKKGGHLLNSGEMVPRDTPEENIRAMIETARSEWQKS